jgi:hypothetical protein
MTFFTTDRFWKCYKELTEQTRREAGKDYKSFKKTRIIPAFTSKEFIRPGLYFRYALQKNIGLWG